MTTELLGLPGAGKTFYLQALQHSPCKKRDIAAHINTNYLQNRLLSIALKSASVTGALGLTRHTAIELAKNDAGIRKQAGERIRRIAYAQELTPFFNDDFYEMVDSLYREIILGLYCQREGLKLVNDDGAVQRILSLIGLRNLEVDMAARRKACEAVASELSYVKEVKILKVEPDFAYTRCLKRKSGVPRLMKHLNEMEIKQRFTVASTIIDMIAETLANKRIAVSYFNFVDGNGFARAAIIPQTES